MHDNRFDSLQTSPILVLALNGQAKIAYLWAEAFTDEVVALAVDMAGSGCGCNCGYDCGCQQAGNHIFACPQKESIKFWAKTKLNKKNRTIKYVH